MATYKPELHSIDGVLSYYEQYDEAAYQVFAGHKPDSAYCRFTYTGNDKGIGKEKLLEALQSVVSNPDNTNTYLLQIISAKGKKFEPINSITFQLNKPNQYYPIQQSSSINHELMNKLNAIEQRIALMEDEEDEEDEPDQLQGLGALINSPQIQNLFMQGLMNMINGNKKPQMAAVAGIPEDETQKISVAIDTLKKSVPDLGNKLLKLADMSINEPIKFKTLLNFL